MKVLSKTPALKLSGVNALCAAGYFDTDVGFSGRNYVAVGDSFTGSCGIMHFSAPTVHYLTDVQATCDGYTGTEHFSIACHSNWSAAPAVLVRQEGRVLRVVAWVDASDPSPRPLYVKAKCTELEIEGIQVLLTAALGKDFRPIKYVRKCLATLEPGFLDSLRRTAASCKSLHNWWLRSVFRDNASSKPGGLVSAQV